MSMLLRRRMMGQGGEPPAPGIGEFSASYEATLTPGSTSEWTIRHNLGVVPKCVIIEMAGEPSMTNYCSGAIYELDMLETQGGNTGFAVGKYHYNNADSYAGKALPNDEAITFNAASLTVFPVHSTARSPWDMGTTYSVQVFG